MAKSAAFLCSVTATLSIIGGKWKPILIYTLSSGSIRFGQLDAIVAGISRKILTEQLKDLEANGLVIRTQFNKTLPRVEYSLSEKGKSLKPLMKAMNDWRNQFVLADEIKLKTKKIVVRK